MRHLLIVLIVCACVAPGAARAANPGVRHALESSRAQQPRAFRRHAVRLGALLKSKDGGQIYGYDINQNGNDGVLATAQTETSGGELLVSMETFDQDTGKVTKVFAKHRGGPNSYAVDGIFAGDIALVTQYHQEKHSFEARRSFPLMNPVTANAFTGTWTQPFGDVLLWGTAENQTTQTAALFAYDVHSKGSLEQPVLIVTNLTTNASTVYKLDVNLFGVADGPIIGEYTAANEAVFALTPDGGRVGGEAPVNVLVDMSTGKTKQFKGLNEGPYGSGDVNGMAVDPNTGIAATTTELNAQAEFYDLKKQAGFAVQLPCTDDTDQSQSGSGITVDPINKLFLVTMQSYCSGSQGSAIVVYDEEGNLAETLTGFDFPIGESGPAINPSKRMGWAFGGPDGFDELQQFFY